MRTVYLGTSAFAAAVLDRLAESPHRPVLVVTRPDRPKGRGRQVQPPPVAIRARELGLDVIQPDRLHDDDVLARIAAATPEVACVCAYGVLIKEPLLSAYEMLNVHPSLLPRWRGAAPVERAIMAGDEQTGVSIMRVTEGLDSGAAASIRASTSSSCSRSGWITSSPSSRARMATGGDCICRPRPLGRSGRVTTSAGRCELSASRSRTAAAKADVPR